MKARSGGIAPRLGLVLVGSTLVACVAVVVTLPLAAAESAAVGGLSVECDLEQAAFALRMDPVGVFLRGPLPSLAAGPGPLVRPGQHDWAQAESLRTDTGGRRLTVTFCPEEAADAPDLVYTFGISGDGRHVDLCAEVADAAQPLRSRLQAQVTWGQAGFPCRLEPGDHPEVVQMALGDVSSRLCHSLFDPQTDTAVTFGGGKLTIAPPTADGGHTLTVESESDRVGPVEAFAVEVTPDYFRRGRGIQWYAPLDKSAFGEPPSGWCSWHYYYASITEEEMVRNTDWLAAKLKPFGLEYVQLDDGYQTQSWTEWNAKFPHGGKWMADHIHRKGLKAGLWLTPFSQGDPELVEQHPDWFLRDAEGKAVETFKGPLTIDASRPSALGEWFGPLFRTLCRDWGFDYLKLDGQPAVIGAYRAHHERLADGSVDGVAAYRQALSTIRGLVGEDTYLLGSWGTPLEAMGLVNGSRTGGDVGASWRGVEVALHATKNWYFLHNVAWYCDPDAICVRPPLSLAQATAWATLLGVTGQHLMSGDRMYDLPEERVELLRRIYPPADIRPMDLYRYEGRPRAWDLKVAAGGEQYDVVALFNWREEPSMVGVDYAALGLHPEGRYVVYDFWNERLVGELAGGVSAWLPPTSARVYAIRPVVDRPVLLSTSRHITQGALDLRGVRWSGGGRDVTGTSEVVGGDPYTIAIYLPTSPRRWTLKSARAEVASVETETDGQLARVTLTSPESRAVRWHVTFGNAPR